MKKLTPALTACAALVMLSFGVAPSANAGYIFTDLGTLGGVESSARAINNSGQVAGYALTTDGYMRATIWNGTTATDLGWGNSSVAHGINNAGQVVGQAFTANYTGIYAPLWNGGTTTDLGTLGGNYSYAKAINNTGQVAGHSTPTDNSAYLATHWNGTTITNLGIGNGYGINNAGQVVGGTAEGATLWNGTTATYLGTLGGLNSAAYAINNAGQIAGWSETWNPLRHATLWYGNTITDLGTLGGSSSTAYAINNLGQVVGGAYTSGDYNFLATLWNGTTAIDLNSFLDAGTISAGWVLKEAFGINDNGWIVGDAYNYLTGANHAYLLSDATTGGSVPEPATHTMLLAGLGLLGFMARRRKEHTA